MPKFVHLIWPSIGSPAVESSIALRKVSLISGIVSVANFLPPPFFLILDLGIISGAFSSFNPSWIIVLEQLTNLEG